MDWNAHQQRLRSLLGRVPESQPPSPWERSAWMAIGGLTEVGFVPGTVRLLLVSSSGRGLLDCRTGEVIARDRNTQDWGWYDTSRLVAECIGSYDGVEVPLSGLHGGGLPNSTEDGWSVELFQPNWPENWVVLQSDYSSVLMEHTQPGRHLPKATRIASDTDLRAVGFSADGTVLVVATGSDVAVHRRSPS